MALAVQTLGALLARLSGQAALGRLAAARQDDPAVPRARLRRCDSIRALRPARRRAWRPRHPRMSAGVDRRDEDGSRTRGGYRAPQRAAGVRYLPGIAQSAVGPRNYAGEPAGAGAIPARGFLAARELARPDCGTSGRAEGRHRLER